MYIIAVFVIGVVSVYPYIDMGNVYILEPDFPIYFIGLYHKAFSTFSFGWLPGPGPSPYFEGHSLLYGLLACLRDWISGTPRPIEQSAWSTVAAVNGVAHIVATLTVFATARRLGGDGGGGGGIIGVMIAALFALSPQLLDIDLVRVDRLMLMPLAVVLYVSVRQAQRAAGFVDGLMLGAAMALLTATKISGFLFAVFPAVAIAAALALSRFDRAACGAATRMVAGAVIAGLPLLAFLMLRYLPHLGHFPVLLRESYAMQMAWMAVIPTTPLLYYNIDNFLGSGVVFLGVVAACTGVVIKAALRRPDPVAVWLLVCLAGFSLAGAATFKYSRGGYHLIPLYLFTIAFALGRGREWLAARYGTRTAGLATPAAAVLLLAVPLAVQWAAFAPSATTAMDRPAAVAQTRTQPRLWIAAHFPPGARLCLMVSSQWATPLDGLDMRIETDLLNIPYLDPAAMASYAPPTLEQTAAACDGVVLNDFHKQVYMNDFRHQGHEAQARRWEAFFDDLARAYPPQVFTSATKAYHVQRVEIFDVRRRPSP